MPRATMPCHHKRVMFCITTEKCSMSGSRIINISKAKYQHGVKSGQNITYRKTEYKQYIANQAHSAVKGI